MRKRLRVFLVLWLAVVLGAMVGMFIEKAARAEAPLYPIVYVELDWQVETYWWSATSTSVAFVDQYTGSSMRWGDCRYGYRCIHIREHSSGYAGVTYVLSPSVAYIDLNPTMRSQPYWFRQALVTHELGHANGLGHNPYCTSVMYIPITFGCSTSFTYAERQILWGN